LDSAPNGMLAVQQVLGDAPAAGTNGPVLAFYRGESRTNARLRPAFVNVPNDLTELGATYPTLVVDMQAYVFAGELTRRYDAATAKLSVPHGNDAWYLADLLEHFGFPWGDWRELLATWHAHKDQATRLQVFDLRQLAQ